MGNARPILNVRCGAQGTKPMAEDLSRKQAARKEREERLAAQLRENLKRRKAQARARKPSGTPEDTQNR